MAQELRLLFAKNLRRYRLERGLTQVELAELLGVNSRYVQQLEGEKAPNVTVATLEKIANALNIKANLLIDD